MQFVAYIGEFYRGPARLTINVPEPLVSSNSAQPRRPLSARARRGGAFTADDLPGLAGMATRIRRHGPLAPVSRRGREDLWPSSAASGASRAFYFDCLAPLRALQQPLVAIKAAAVDTDCSTYFTADTLSLPAPFLCCPSLSLTQPPFPYGGDHQPCQGLSTCFEYQEA